MTPSLAAAALYAGLGGLIALWHAWVVISLRFRLAVSIGDGGQPRLARAMRGQANFTEYAPLMFVLLFAMALMGAPAWVVHVFGAVFILARVMHAAHFLAADAPRWLRFHGALLTLICVGLGGAGVAAHAFARIAWGGA